MRCLNCMKEYDEQYGVCPFCGFVPGTPPKEAYHLTPGTVLKNRYLIGTTVGFGGFGITYRAWDLSLERKVAVKEYYPNGVVNRVPGEKKVIVYTGNKANEFASGKTRFLDEARNMTHFNTHPNIVNVYEFFEENNTAYIAMEFLEGESYKDYIREKGGCVDQDTAVSVVLSVLDALKEIHKAHIIHRDVSPDNIFMVPVGEDGLNYRVKLIDFGAACFSTGDEEKTLSIILKPGYAPPEQYRTKSKQGPWTDIYAVGAVLYRSLTGIMPEESVNRMVEDHLQPPSQLKPEISEQLNDTILRAMALNQELRFQNTDQFREALQNRTKVLGVEAELKRRKRLRILSMVGIVAVVAGVGAGCFGVYAMKQKKLYGLESQIAVQMPDINGLRQGEIEQAASTERMSDGDAEKTMELETSQQMLSRMLEEYSDKFQKVEVSMECSDQKTDYREILLSQQAGQNFPSVIETTGITKADSKLWEKLGSLDTTYAELDAGNYYFMKDEAFQEYFAAEKKQIPISFSAPVLYVNTHMISDRERLEALSELTSLHELKDEDGNFSFCVSGEFADMYREAFPKDETAQAKADFMVSAEKGYEPFLKREKAFYLGSTDDYEMIRASLGGIYQMIVLNTLQEEGKVKGRFTHLWSINGSLENDDKRAADSLVYYLMSERAQDVFNVQDGNGLSMNKRMLETYVKGNDEFEGVLKGLDTLQMDYSGGSEV